MTTTEQVNQLIKTLNCQGILDTSGVSDGENTFQQLYDRIAELEGVEKETDDEYLARLIETARPTMQSIDDPEKWLAEVRGYEEEEIGYFEVQIFDLCFARFRLKTQKGLTLFKSCLYPTKSACLDKIRDFKESITDESKWEREEDFDGEWIARLYFGNGKFLGKTKYTPTEQSLDKTIEAIKAISPTAEIVYREVL